MCARLWLCIIVYAVSSCVNSYTHIAIKMQSKVLMLPFYNPIYPLAAAAAAAKSLQLCPTLSDPMDCSPPGSSIHGIVQARVLEWGAIAFSVSPRSIPEPSPQCRVTINLFSISKILLFWECYMHIFFKISFCSFRITPMKPLLVAAHDTVHIFLSLSCVSWYGGTTL